MYLFVSVRMGILVYYLKIDERQGGEGEEKRWENYFLKGGGFLLKGRRGSGMGIGWVGEGEGTMKEEMIYKLF